MTKNTILKWRLAERPSAENILKLVDGGVITKEEARKIVLDEGEFQQGDIENIKNEIDLLRKLVLEVMSKQSTIYVPYVRTIIQQTPIYPWTNPYMIWCSLNSNTTMSGNSNIVNC